MEIIVTNSCAGANSIQMSARYAVKLLHFEKDSERILIFERVLTLNAHFDSLSSSLLYDKSYVAMSIIPIRHLISTESPFDSINLNLRMKNGHSYPLSFSLLCQ